MEKGYKITLSRNGQDNNNTAPTQEIDNSALSKGKQPKAVNNPNAVLGIVAINTAKTAISYGLSNYGNLTGDYITQDNIQSGLEVFSLAMMASMGPVGIAAATMSVGLKAATRQLDVYNKNTQVNFLRQRVGMNESSGGRLWQ